MDKEPYQLVLLIAALLAISCFAAFFYLIDHASRLLRPVAVLTKVGDAGLAVIDSVYPKHAPAADIPLSSREELGPPARTVVHQGKSGILLAVNLSLLVNDAEKFDGVIELVPQVGDFVAIDDPVFNLYGGARVIDDGTLRSSVAFGSERTLQQDPTFAFRIVVDIAIRALSPAINDPTTAVLAIDQLHRMLRAVGQHHLHDDRVVGRSAKVRVIFRTPDWDDFVHIAMSEIRACGYSNIQVVRRARSMIETLLRTLPARRHPALEQELGLLNREVKSRFVHPEDIALAMEPDSQGLGGRFRASDVHRDGA